MKTSYAYKLYQTMFPAYPDVVDVETLCEMLGGVSKKLAYKLLTQGKIKSLKVGRSYRIPKIYVAEYLVGQLDDVC